MTARDQCNGYKKSGRMVNYILCCLPVQDTPARPPLSDVSLMQSPQIIRMFPYIASRDITARLCCMLYLLYCVGIWLLVDCVAVALSRWYAHRVFSRQAQEKKKKKRQKDVLPGFFPRANLGTISPKLIRP